MQLKYNKKRNKVYMFDFNNQFIIYFIKKLKFAMQFIVCLKY